MIKKKKEQSYMFLREQDQFVEDNIMFKNQWLPFLGNTGA